MGLPFSGGSISVRVLYASQIINSYLNQLAADWRLKCHGGRCQAHLRDKQGRGGWCSSPPGPLGGDPDMGGAGKGWMEAAVGTKARCWVPRGPTCSEGSLSSRK